MTVVDLKSFYKTIEVNFFELFNEDVHITLREPNTPQYIDLRKLAAIDTSKGESNDQVAATSTWVRTNLPSLIVEHNFDEKNTKALADALCDNFGTFMKITNDYFDFLGTSNGNKKKQGK